MSCNLLTYCTESEKQNGCKYIGVCLCDCGWQMWLAAAAPITIDHESVSPGKDQNLKYGLYRMHIAFTPS